MAETENERKLFTIEQPQAAVESSFRRVRANNIWNDVSNVIVRQSPGPMRQTKIKWQIGNLTESSFLIIRQAK